MEVYIRINDSSEKDTCIQLEETDTVNNKLKLLFTKKGMGRYLNLTPTVFHEELPYIFYKSVHPGFMTDTGALLFDEKCDEEKYLVELDAEKPLFKQLWPGQLIIPKFKKSVSITNRYWLFIMFWLYTDLPDFISPTPGMCLTNQISRCLIYIFNYLGFTDLADTMQKEIAPNFTSVGLQIGIFVFHIIKIAILTLYLETGFLNPVSYNPYKNYKLLNEGFGTKTGKEYAKRLGWIGTQRATDVNYRTGLFNYIINSYGGQVQAYRQGKIPKTMDQGFTLTDGEGFQTPLDQRYKASTFETMEKKRKFVLADDYYKSLENNLVGNLEKHKKANNSGKYSEEIRRFRKYGLFDVDEEMQHMVDLRKEVHPKYGAKTETEEEKKKK